MSGARVSKYSQANEPSRPPNRYSIRQSPSQVDCRGLFWVPFWTSKKGRKKVRKFYIFFRFLIDVFNGVDVMALRTLQGYCRNRPHHSLCPQIHYPCRLHHACHMPVNRQQVHRIINSSAAQRIAQGAVQVLLP